MTWIVCKAITGEDGLTRVTASTPTSDRYGDVVSAPWSLDRYRANPVVVFAHDYSQPAVGKAVDVRLEGENLVATIQWDDHPSNPLGQTVAHQFRSGFLNAVSVGFQPGIAIRRSQLDASDPYYAEKGNWFKDNELLEISAVPIPANPDALATRSLSPWMERHILEVEDTDEGLRVLYARPGEQSEEQPEEPVAEASSWKDDEEEEKRSLRDSFLDMIRTDASIQGALAALHDAHKESARGIDDLDAESPCGITSVIDDLFGFTD